MAPDAPNRVTAVLHAWHWPDAAALEPLLDAIRRAASRFGPVQIIEARERAEAAVGAAALVNAAAARGTGSLLLVLRPHRRWSFEHLDELLSSGTSGLVMAGEDLWAIPHAIFDRLGGLDERFWSVGEVDDLAARAGAAGIPVRRVPLAAPAIAREPYPLRPEVQAFLSTRNRLLTAFKTLPPESLGRATIAGIEAAFVEAFEAAGLDPSSLAIGAPTPPTAADISRPGQTLAPLLALDSLVSEVTGVAPR